MRRSAIRDRAAARALAVAAVLMLSGCAAKTTTVTSTTENGVERYAQSRVRAKIVCKDMPIVLQGSRTDLELTGPCRSLTVAGEHNDIVADIVPGGTIEITGAHNDVTWRKIGEGPDPTLKPTGPSNSFHRG